MRQITKFLIVQVLFYCIMAINVYPGVTYDWDFGDGSPHSFDSNPVHKYINSGTYNWRLTSMKDGVSCEKSGTIIVTNTSPTVLYDWDFGDGSAHSTEANPTHIYTAPGAYIWTMTSTVNGQSCQKSGTIVVDYVLPSVTYDWDFGDGSSHSYEANPTHIYTTPGTYTWKMTASYDGQECLRTGIIKINPDNFLTVLTPNGGEIWNADSQKDIIWTSSDSVNDVKIDYSTSGTNGTYIPIVPSVPNTGAFQWTIPAIDSSQCIIRISDLSETLVDYSDTPFTIETPATITVTTPNGGEKWKPGMSYNILWSQEKLTDEVTIHLYKGENFLLNLGTAPANSGSFSWLVPVDLNLDCDYKVTVSQGAVNDFSDETFSIVDTVIHPDFNKDGWSDILWRNKATGQNGTWLMEGVERTGICLINNLTDTDWMCIGVADLNSDDKTDILWRHRTTGENAVWYMDGTSRMGNDYFNTLSDIDWVCGGLADFNGDGKTDILWRHQLTGQNGVWFMNGITRTDINFINTLSNTDWVCGGAADFNGDNRPDIFWRNKITGENAVWYMNGITKIGYDYLAPLSDTNWICGGLADYSGDGKVDILWRNKTTGENGIWVMNGIIRSEIFLIKSLSDLDWEIVN